jgi:uncharacterized protein YukE
MYVKVNRNEMEQLANKMDTNTNDLEEEFNNCISDLNRLKEAYDSTESKYIIDTMTLYFEKMNTVPTALREISDLIKKAGNIYVENDSSFKKELEKLNIEEEEDEKLLY